MEGVGCICWFLTYLFLLCLISFPRYHTEDGVGIPFRVAREVISELVARVVVRIYTANHVILFSP